jgi:hypothetical protein
MTATTPIISGTPPRLGASAPIGIIRLLLGQLHLTHCYALLNFHSQLPKTDANAGSEQCSPCCAGRWVGCAWQGKEETMVCWYVRRGGAGGLDGQIGRNDLLRCSTDAVQLRQLLVRQESPLNQLIAQNAVNRPRAAMRRRPETAEGVRIKFWIARAMLEA